MNIKDTSRNGTYHSKAFMQTAQTHGLIVERTEKYGWAKTSPADELLEWLLEHDELREIEMCRINPESTPVGVGARSADKLRVGAVSRVTYRYCCASCNALVRSSQPVALICGTCFAAMQAV